MATRVPRNKANTIQLSLGSLNLQFSWSQLHVAIVSVGVHTYMNIMRLLREVK
jgi:hypothetical protein